MKVIYPRVKINSSSRVYVVFYQNNKRYRLFNGSKINSEIYPNSYPISKRIEMGNLLASEVYKFLISGLTLEQIKVSNLIKSNMTDKDYLTVALENKLKENYTKKYKEMLQFIFNRLIDELNDSPIQPLHIETVLNKYNSESSYNTYRLRLCSLINEARKIGMTSNPMQRIKSKRTKAQMHKPFKNVNVILEAIKAYNKHLYLCCLMTYGCLLRPHREIRELTWSDFSDDLKYIHLSGSRNKSGRNRIVPVPKYVRDILVKGERHHNIFSGKPKPLNKDYFKTLWSRFKRQSNILEQGQTLYSFRHSGAIEIFKRTGSITKLQKAMGHSSINVSLTYLRGLEIAELKEEDMPIF
ncbi:tyrosine-type recombinase/integrase [uncultured Polaribacter sp.]|uniref:tyrosine-type recombinase/integrase n=1 Tax=uncultured Polaribacter sp. TaxID=174711 RepID=UPI0026238C40|nr:tyrosine-type recombinase/integrase [uncultured Polaribacter sp.]